MDYYLGIDIGGSKIKAVLLEGFNLPPLKLLTTGAPDNKSRFLAVLSQVVKSILPQGGLAGIGVGLPGIIAPQKGILVKAPNLPFLDGWAVKIFFKKFKTLVKIDNDVNCFLRAEAIKGAGKGCKNIIAVALGTGIGGGVMINGKIYQGSHNSAGEFGHMVFQIAKDKESMVYYQWEGLAGKEAFLKYGDCSEIVGIGVANLINAFDPDIILLGGGRLTSGAVELHRVRAFAKKYIISPASKKIPIVPTKLGDYASAIGAGLLFQNSK